MRKKAPKEPLTDSEMVRKQKTFNYTNEERLWDDYRLAFCTLRRMVEGKEVFIDANGLICTILSNPEYYKEVNNESAD